MIAAPPDPGWSAAARCAPAPRSIVVIRQIIDRAKASYPARLLTAYGQTQAGNYAGSVAMGMFMSMFPLMLGVLAILGLVLQDPALHAKFVDALISYFPSEAGKSLASALETAGHNSGILAIVAILGMLWSGTSVFTTLEWVLDRLFGARQRGFLRQRLMGLAMTGIFIVAVLATVALNSAVSLLKVLPFSGPLVGLLVWFAFFLIIYRVVPHRTFHFADIWRGALLAGVLMEALSLLWPVYVALTHGFSSYGAAFALFFLLASWLILLSQFLLIGAVANRLSLGPPITEGLAAEPDAGPIETGETQAIESEQRSQERHPAF